MGDIGNEFMENLEAISSFVPYLVTIGIEEGRG